jgi:hypothetical protein
MKGPSGRLRHQVRRVWQCPVCQRREYTGGDVVNLACDCQAKAEPPRWTWMRLIEEDPPTAGPGTAVKTNGPAPT